MEGEAALSGPMAGKIIKEFARLAETEAGHIASQLTAREKEVLQKLSEGLSNRQIGLALCISKNTVKTHVTNILRKLGLESRFQTAAYVRRWGLDEGKARFVQKCTKY